VLVAERGRSATIAGFGRAGELGIAVLTGADGGQAIRDASRADVTALAADGKLEVTVDKALPLEEAPEAHRYLQTGHARGKVVLVP
jgi:NADPH:quinone reductase-like Zn-dependent oxidoreductase